MQLTIRSVLKNAIVFFTGAACASAVFWIGFQAYYQPKLDDASVEVLQERLSELAPLSAKQQKILADEMIRVRKYERRLRKRAAALDALLNDTLELDQTRDAPLFDDIAFSAEPRSTDVNGVGGSIEPIAPIVQLSSTPATEEKVRAKLAKERLRTPPDEAIFEYPQDTLHLLDFHTLRIAHVPMGAPSTGRMSSNFGYRRSPFSGRKHFHKGIDFAVDRRTPVSATANGVVEKAGYMSGYGLVVVVNHQNGYETLYAHLSEIRVNAGDTVCRGNLVGLVGSTGRSTGPHVHYEVRKNGKAVNPVPFVNLVTFLRFV